MTAPNACIKPTHGPSITQDHPHSHLHGSAWAPQPTRARTASEGNGAQSGPAPEGGRRATGGITAASASRSPLTGRSAALQKPASLGECRVCHLPGRTCHLPC